MASRKYKKRVTFDLQRSLNSNETRRLMKNGESTSGSTSGIDIAGLVAEIEQLRNTISEMEKAAPLTISDQIHKVL